MCALVPARVQLESSTISSLFSLLLFKTTGISMMDEAKTTAEEDAANLESEALKRKKRIEALRQLKEQQEQSRQSKTEAEPLPR